MSTLRAPAPIPGFEHTGRVTQLRVVRLGVDEAPLGALDPWSLGCGLRRHDRPPGDRRRVVSNHWPQMSAARSREFQPLDVSLAGVQLAQLAIGVLGVLVITAEYSTGMIRASMTAVPARFPVLWAKASSTPSSCSS